MRLLSVIALVLGVSVMPVGLLAGEDLQDTETNILDGNTRQDGHVAEDGAKRYVADEVVKEGKPPFSVVRLRKTFTPPSGWKFRPFRPDEKDINRIREALRTRKDPHDDIEWKFWKAEPEYVDIWFDPEEAIVFGEPPSVFESLAEAEGPSMIRVSGALADSQKASKFPLRCDGNLVPPGGPGHGGAPKEYHWSAIVAGAIDLDIDTDNTAGVYGGPDRDLIKEDRWESDGGKKVKVGKYVPRDDGDADNDLIPGFADGFGMFGPDSNVSKGTKFVKAILDISNVEDVINWNKATVLFKYAVSDPNKTVKKGEKEKEFYVPDPGAIRIWTKDGDKQRDPNPVSANGDWVKNEEFLAAKLFKGKNTVELYLEGIVPGEDLIEVEFAPLGGKPKMPDEVKLTVIQVDIDVDSDNDNEKDPPQRDEFEDRVEDAKGKKDYPGKLLEVNDGDHDVDGIPDYADGFDAFKGLSEDDVIGANGNGASPSFTPLVIELIKPLDPEKLRLRIDYSAAEPSESNVRRISDGEGGFIYSVGGGKLRIWKKNADQKRNRNSTKHKYKGDFVAPGEYEGDELADIGFNGNKAELWLEGIQITNGEQIKVEVDPDGKDGPADWVHLDAVRVTTIKTKTTPWLVTHDPVFEAQYAQKKPESFKQAELMGNAAFAALWGIPPGTSDEVFAELWAAGGLLKKAKNICEGDYRGIVNGAMVWQFRTTAGSKKGAKTDKGGNVYIERKETSPGWHEIRFYKKGSGSKKKYMAITKQMWIGPIVSELDRIKRAFTDKLDHYSDEFSLSFGRGYGMPMKYSISEQVGEIDEIEGLFRATQDTMIQFVNDQYAPKPDQGDLAGPALLYMHDELFEPGGHKIKWEGFNDKLAKVISNGEKADEIVKKGEEASTPKDWGPSSSRQRRRGLSPLYAVGEGKYGMQVGVKLVEDGDQKQEIWVGTEIMFIR